MARSRSAAWSAPATTASPTRCHASPRDRLDQRLRAVRRTAHGLDAVSTAVSTGGQLVRRSVSATSRSTATCSRQHRTRLPHPELSVSGRGVESRAPPRRATSTAGSPTRPTASTAARSAARTIFTGGFVRHRRVTQNDALYRIPGVDGEIHGTRIDARAGPRCSARASSGRKAPRSKRCAAGPASPTTSTTRSVLRPWAIRPPATASARPSPTRRQEGRVEVQLAPFRANFAVHHHRSGYARAVIRTSPHASPDDVGSPINGLWDPNTQHRVAGYIFNEFQFGPSTKAQIAGRVEHVNLSGTTPSVIPRISSILAPIPTAIGPQTPARPRTSRRRAGVSASSSNLPWFGLVGSITAQYVERAPQARRAVLARRARCDRRPSTSASPNLEHRDREIDRGGLAQA